MLETELQRIYDSEINVRIDWLWDGGIDVRLGDELNGYLAQENASSIDGIVPWLQEMIAHFYPDSYLREILGSADQGAGGTPAIPATEHWRSGALP